MLTFEQRRIVKLGLDQRARARTRDDAQPRMRGSRVQCKACGRPVGDVEGTPGCSTCRRRLRERQRARDKKGQPKCP